MTAKVGLTGGIGSGKSTVGDIFRQCGVLVIDADQIATELYAPGSPYLDKIASYFGPDILIDNGHLDRKKLGNIIFSDTQKKKWLESLIHPAIRTEMHALANSDTGSYCVFEIPLLVETGQYKKMDRVLVVQCDKAIRIDRITRNRDLTTTEAKRIIANQITDDQRVAVADDVVKNNDGIDELTKKVKLLHQSYLKIWG